MPTIADIIQDKNRQILENIALSFKETDIELIKGLTHEEFDTKYPKSEYEVYSEQAVNKFADDLKKSEDADILEKGKKDISKLQKKTVIGKDGKRHTVYVRQGEVKKEEGKELT